MRLDFNADDMTKGKLVCFLFIYIWNQSVSYGRCFVDLK